VILALSGARAQDTEIKAENSFNLSWLSDCTWDQALQSEALSKAILATSFFERGDTQRGHKEFEIAVAAALSTTNLDQKLWEGRCVATAQSDAGLIDDAVQMLQQTFKAARAHWLESEPVTVYSPALGFLQLAALQRGLGVAEDHDATLAFLNSAFPQRPPGWDMAMTSLKLGQAQMVFDNPSAATAAFASARQMILERDPSVSGDAANEAWSAGDTNTTLLLTALALGQAEAGVFDDALGDIELARSQYVGANACSRDTRDLTENLILRLRKGAVLSEIIGTQEIPESCQ
jgi:hypothetical protein